MKPIIDPKEFLRYASPALIEHLRGAERALVCFDPETFRELRKCHPVREIRGLSGEAWLLEQNLLLCGNLGIGAPAAVALLEELIGCGIRRFVGFGTAGALHERLHAGDIVLCQEAFIDEGTSAHYDQDSISSVPSVTLHGSLQDYLDREELLHFPCRSWTTDAPYRETPERLARFLALGADVVEMEASAIFTVARFRQVEAVCLFIVGDSISDGVWKPYFRKKEIRMRMVEVGMKLMGF